MDFLPESSEGDPGRRVDVRVASPETLLSAADAKRRAGRRTAVPVRYSFVSRESGAGPDGQSPPMAAILRGGRGGEVRLKLELGFLWLAISPPYEVRFPARAWAALIGLDDPAGRGARRVRQATAALSAAGLVEINQRPGQPSSVLLLDDDGSGNPYESPGSAFNQNRGSGMEGEHRYIRLPDTLWTSGWMATLSGAAVAMLLVLHVELRNAPAVATDLWFSPDQAVKLYGLSADTRSKGLRELRAAGLVSARRRSASRGPFDFRRLRNTYRLQVDRFSDPASVPLNTAPPPPMSPSNAEMEDLFGLPPDITSKTGARGSPFS